MFTRDPLERVPLLRGGASPRGSAKRPKRDARDLARVQAKRAREGQERKP